MKLFNNKKGTENAKDTASIVPQLEGYFDPTAADDTVKPDRQQKPARPVRTPADRKGLGIRIVAGLAAMICLVSMTSSAWYFNDYMQDTMTKRALPTVTRSLAHNMQKVSYAPAISFALRLETASVEEDLGVTIYDEWDKIVVGYPFEVRITPVDGGDAVEMTDEDMDGQVYFEGLTPGKYDVELLKADGYFMPQPVQGTVQPKVTYERIDVSEKVVDAKDINAAEDDAQFGGKHGADSGSSNVPSSDTVEFVESSSKSETKTTTVDKIVNGVQVYAYKPTLSNGHLVLADGTVSDLIAVLDASGYLVKGQREKVVAPPVDPPPTDPPAETQNNGDPNNAAGTGGPEYEDVQLIDGSYNLLADPTTKQAFKAEKIKVTETKTETVTTYYGWQTFGGKTYYFDKNGVKVTGWQVIKGISYVFNEDGSRGGKSTGIDVSTWQTGIDWNKVKNAGIDYVFVRLGFRGYGTGKLVLDDMYHSHMKGALAAGLKVGVYFFTQAVNAQEAVEEASMCLQYVANYRISYPIAIDIEWAASNARTNSLTNAQRTEVCRAFCETIRNAGYTAAIYANKDWLTNKLNTSQLETYVIWLAHFTEQTNYARKYDIWQYTSTGSVPGIPGSVDMNISYL